jgi:hypothetical protein
LIFGCLLAGEIVVGGQVDDHIDIATGPDPTDGVGKLIELRDIRPNPHDPR